MAFVFQGRPAIAWSTKYLPHVPQPKQHAYLWLDCMEAMYGGAAGGGKSDALLMAALQYIEVPGYSALLLRKTYPELTMPGGLIFRSHEWLGNTDARWNDNEKRWKFPNGSTLDFGFLKNDQDKLRYQGAEYQFCVALDTPIMMADRSWKPLREVQVGDLVHTLEGPRRVLRLHRPGLKECVRVTTPYGECVVSATHRLLTGFGWASPQELKSGYVPLGLSSLALQSTEQDPLRHSRFPTSLLVHPYTKEAMDPQEDVHLCLSDMAPAGEVEVGDLTVEGASHYVAWPGIISSNCGFDELTQFKQSDYLYLFSRLRRLQGSRVPIRMRAATNPGGPGHRWVRDRFILKKPLEDTSIEVAKAGARIFIPAKLSDNRYIDQDMYTMALSELDEHTRAQLLEGDWNARLPGNWMIDHRHIDAIVDRGRAMRPQFLEFLATNDPLHFPPPVNDMLDLGIDWGEHTQGYVIWPLERGGVYIPETEPESVQEHGEPGLFAEKFIPKALSLGYPIRSARYDAAGVQSMRTFGRTVRANFEELAGMRTTSIPFNKFKRETINYMRLLGRRTDEKYTTRVWVIDPLNDRLIDQLYGWERKDEESEDAVKEDDHGPDACVSGMAPIARKHREQQLEMVQKAKQQRVKEALQR